MKTEMENGYLVVDAFFLSSGKKILAIQDCNLTSESFEENSWEVVIPSFGIVPIIVKGEHILKGQTKLLNCRAFEVEGDFQKDNWGNGNAIFRLKK